jgi:Zn-dependent peptidase ImmA (M78 family)
MRTFPAQPNKEEVEKIYNACREYLNNVEKYLKLPKKQVLEELFKIKDIRKLKAEIIKYKWGVLEALESYVEFPAYLFKEKLFSARVPRGNQNKEAVKNNALLIKRAVAIQTAFDENLGKEPKLEKLKEIWQQGLLTFLKELEVEIKTQNILESLEQALTKNNIFIFYFQGATISGLATKNFIFINENESLGRQIWTLFHELLHIIYNDFAFRTPGDSKETKHEEEVGDFLLEIFLPKPVNKIVDSKNLEEVAKTIANRHPLKLNKYAIKKWLSKKTNIKLKFEPFNKIKTKNSYKGKGFRLRPSKAYLDLIEPFKKRDLEVYAALQGLSLEELLMEQPETLKI